MFTKHRQDPADVAVMPLDEMTRALIRRVGTVFDTHVAFPCPEARDAVVLWVMHSHAYRAFDSTPRLSVRSTQPGSGKSVVLELIEHLAPNAVNVINVTPGTMWRLMEHSQPTLVIDEADTTFGKNGSSSAHAVLRGIINAGHKRNGTVPRCVGSDEVKQFHVFGPVAMAGLGRLPETIATRSIEVVMKRIPMTGDAKIVPLRMRFAEAALAAIRGQLEVWGKLALPVLSECLPELPVKARAADVWEPVVAVADLAGAEWPDRARKACVKLAGIATAEKTANGVQLLLDLRTVLGASSGAMFTHEVVESLCAMDSVWDRDNMDARKLSRMLSEYGIGPKMIRRGALTQRGYQRASFEPAWEYYASAMHEAAVRETQTREGVAA